MKKFFMSSFLLVNVLGTSTASLVSANTEKKVCPSCCRPLSNEKRENRKSSYVATAAMFVVRSVVQSVLDIFSFYIAVDCFHNGEKSLVGISCSKVKEIAEKGYDIAKDYTKKTAEKLKAKLAECTDGKDNWRKTNGYFSTNESDATVCDVAKEVAVNAYDFSKEKFNKAVDGVSEFFRGMNMDGMVYSFRGYKESDPHDVLLGTKLENNCIVISKDRNIFPFIRKI